MSDDNAIIPAALFDDTLAVLRAKAAASVFDDDGMLRENRLALEEEPARGPHPADSQTATEGVVRLAFVECFKFGDTPADYDAARATFDRWLTHERAKGWDEGRDSLFEDADHIDGWAKRVNPYSGERGANDA